MFPHILDLILAFSDHDALTEFARTNKAIRKRIFDRYLPVKRIVLHGQHGMLGVDKNNAAIPIADRIVKKNGSAVHLVEVIKAPGTKVILCRLMRKPRPASICFPNIRYVPSGRTDLFLTMRRARTGDGNPPPTVTATLPFSLHDPLNPETSGLIKGVFDELRMVPPSGRASLLVLEPPEYAYDDDPHFTYMFMVADRIVNWLEQRSSPVHLVFVNVEEWLKFSCPGKNAAQVRDIWLTTLKEHLELSRALGLAVGAPTPSVASATLNEATFMSLDEYKRDVGTATFDIHTCFVEPAFPPPQA